MQKYDDIIAIVQKGETCKWQLGERLIKHVGMPPPSSKNDGSHNELEKIAGHLASEGYDGYTVETLRKLRAVAANFPKGKRRRVSWICHRIAGTPDYLDLIIAAAKKKKCKVTPDFCETVLRGMRDPETGKRKPVPNPEDAPNEEDTNLLLLRGEFDVEIAAMGNTLSKAEKALKKLAPHLGEVSNVYITGWAAHLLEHENKLRALRESIQRDRPQKRGHIHAVA